MRVATVHTVSASARLPVFGSLLGQLALNLVLVKDLSLGAAQLLNLLPEEAGDVLLAVQGVGEARMSQGLRDLVKKMDTIFICHSSTIILGTTCPWGPRVS